jgi:hypothetical protein
VIATAISAEACRVSSGPLCLHAVTTTPAVTDGIDSLVPPSTGFGLPRVMGGSAPASAVSGPARCYCTFGLHDSPSRLKRPSTSEAPAASSPPPPLRLLPGGANQFPGGNFNPRWTNALHGTPPALAKGFVETCWKRLSIYSKANFAARLESPGGRSPGSDAPPYRS